MSNNDSSNLVVFTLKALLIMAIVVIVGRSLIGKSEEMKNTTENDIIQNDPESYSTREVDEYDVSSDYDPRVPLCPAKPNGPRVLPGSGYLSGSDEHVNCKEYCLLDREKELQIKLEAKKREARIQALEIQLQESN